MRVQEFGEIIEQLVGAEIVNSAIEIVADTPDRPGVGVDGLWLQTAQLQALQMFLVLLVKVGILRHGGVHCNLLGNRLMWPALPLPQPLSFYYRMP